MDGTIIAVKQLSSKSNQGSREFVNEIGMISGLGHPNLVRLHGCCTEHKQLLLVYEFMENNSLARALFGEFNIQHITYFIINQYNLFLYDTPVLHSTAVKHIKHYHHTLIISVLYHIFSSYLCVVFSASKNERFSHVSCRSRKLTTGSRLAY